MKTKKFFGKRVLSLLLILLMVLSLMPLSVFSTFAAADTSAYAPTRRENYYNDDDAIFANGTAITIEEAPNGTRIWYMSGSTKNYVTANGENGEDLSEWRIFAGSNNQDGMSGVNGSITMTGGTVNRIYAGQHYGGFSGISNVTIFGGTVKEAIVCNSRAMVSLNDYINTVNIFDVTGATISTAGGKADNVVQKKGTVWNVSGNGVVPSGFTLTVNEGETLTVPAGSTLTNNGTIVNNGGTIKLNGQLKGNAPQGYAPLSDVSLSTEAVPANSSTTLTATVTPANNVIMPVVSYELIDAGTTDAVLNGTNLSVYGEGTVKIKVTVSDGYCTPVEKIFAIPVTFTKVTDITGNVPTESWVNVSNTLPAMTVTPDNASYKTFTWSVLNAGTTGAQINGNKLIATNSGTATIRATVANGLAYGTDFVKDYTVTFNSTDKLDISVGSITISKKDDSTLTVSFSGFDGGSKDYAADEPIEITGSTTANNIVVESGTVANIVLNNVEIIGDDKLRAIEIKSGAEADIALLGENTLKGRSGIYINSNSKATIGGTGVLNATTLYNGDHGAIGGLGEGEIVVNGGTITATGETTYNSGIVGTKITINDGIVSATAGKEGAGIGSRRVADYATDVIINGGTVTASGSAGIGGGYGSSGTFSVTINDGIVTASGRGAGAGIGSGRGSAAGKVIINGGNITSSSLNYGAGIGSAMYGKAVDVTINGGTVTSTNTGYRYGAAIGGGYYAETGNIVITGGNIKADSGSTYSEDIGKGYYAESEGTLTDGKGNNIYLNTITLDGVTEQKAVTEVKGVESYGLNDVITLDTNKLYFYLPEEAKVTSITAGGEVYDCTNDNATYYANHDWTDGVCTICDLVCEHEWYYGSCEICGKHCNHSKCDAKFSWENYDGSCYARVELTCTTCGQYADSYGDYAELVEEVEAVDCMHPGSKTYTFSYEYNGEIYSDTKTFEVKSDNHTGEFVNGFCTECGGYQPATLNDNGTPDDEWDDYYEISNAGQLYWFADYINNVSNDAYAKLTADIVVNETLDENLRVWTPIMDFYGNFDGNCHTVSGLYVKSEEDYIGMFGGGYYSYGTVENLGLINSYFEGNDYVGGIAGYHAGTIKNSYITDTVTVVGNNLTGTLVGNNAGTVSNCYAYASTLVGSYHSGYATVENCYYLADTDDGEGGKTAEQFNSGEVAYLLQSGVVGEEIWDDELGEYVQTEPEHIWGQKIGEDTYPVFGGDKVYQVENCVGELAYSNANENGQHNFVNGFCTLCGGFEPATLNEDGVYEIGNAGQLYWFAEYVNAGNTSVNAILTDNIVVNEGVMTSTSTDARVWTPIGNTDYMYTGTFDGNNKTVSGLYFNNTDTKYVGLFGYIGENGTVKNTGVINSYFKGLSAVGGVVGSNNGTITNCYNTGEVSGTYNIGGVVGRNPAGTITSCYNTGIIEGNEFIGGVAGYNDGGTITNCYNTSEVSGSYEVGGVAGKNFEGLISNCYNIGKVSGANDYIGGVAGANQTGTITNCYYLDTAYAGGIGKNNTVEAEDIAGSAEAKTAEAFASGEVAYLLQGEQTEEIWGQKIGTDELPVLGGDKVYMKTDAEGNTVYSNEAAEEKTDKLAGYDISLKGNIALNFYFSLTEETVADENAKFVFTFADGGTSEIFVKDAAVSGNYYAVTCEVPAKEMADEVKAQLITSKGEGEAYYYSVQKYAEYIINEAEKAQENAGGIAGGGVSNTATPEQLAYIKAAPLAKAMLNYCAYAQRNFGYNTDNPANENLDEAEKKLPDSVSFDNWKHSVSGQQEGVSFYGAALSLKSETAVKLYFAVDGDSSAFDVTVNGEAYTLKKNGTLYELKIADIPAHRLGDMYEVKVGSLTVNYGVFSYGCTVMEGDNAKLKDTIKALAVYHEEACNYAS